MSSFSNFSNFAYKRKKSYPSGDRSASVEKENKSSHVNINMDVTPNKTHHGMATTTIPETPTSLLTKSARTEKDSNTQPCSKIRPQTRRRQFARIDSSSDEENTTCTTGRYTPQLQNGSATLFSGIHISKRRKLNDSFGESENSSEIGTVQNTNDSCGSSRTNVDGCHGDHSATRTEDLKSLSELFPQHETEYLETVLDKKGDLDKAISSLLGSTRESPRLQIKRGRRRVLSGIDSDSSPTKPKRAPKRTILRPISDSSSDSDLPSFTDTVTGNYLYTSNQPSPEPSGRLDDTKSKLQKFAFQKKAEHGNQVSGKEQSDQSIPTHNQDDEVVRQDTDSVISITDNDTALVDLNKPSSLTKSENSNRRSSTQKDQAIELDCDFRDEVSASESEDDDYSTVQKSSILHFFVGSTLDELCDIPGCSMTKAKMIVKLRPFDSWENLVESLVSKKRLSEQLLDGCLTLLDERKVLVKLLAKCETISATIHQRFSKMQDTTNQEVSSDKTVVYSHQPLVMNPSVQLKPYQVLGLNWLALLHSQSLNGILADEMGLGKTVQAISFLSHLYQQGTSGLFLVIVPASTIDNWVREFEVWCPVMNVMTYWGTQNERSQMRYEVQSNQDNCDVILTTYSVCIGQPDDRKFFRRLSLSCLILDEGHMLKNMNSQRYTHLMKIKANRRVLLTGTPLQNNLLELMSLLSFVMPDVFQEFSAQIKKTFSRARKVDESSTYYQEQVKQAKQIMQPFMLRRLKSEVLSQLPSKVSETEHCALTDKQWKIYTEIAQRSLKQADIVGDSDPINKRMDVVMNLRKAANHPLLLRHHYTDEKLHVMSRDILRERSHRDADPALVFEDMTVMSDFELHRLCLNYKSLSDHILPCELFGESGKCLFLLRKLSELKEKGDRVLLFSQFTMTLDILEVFLEQQGHTYLRLDGQTPVSERQALIDEFNEEDNIFVFLLSTKAGGLGINLTSANVVIIHDIDFNPYNDKQAEDRCHRVGQKRNVSVVKLVGKETIEEDILQCAQGKLKLEQDITAATDKDEVKKLDVASLLRQSLARSNDHEMSKHT